MELKERLSSKEDHPIHLGAEHGEGSDRRRDAILEAIRVLTVRPEDDNQCLYESIVPTHELGGGAQFWSSKEQSDKNRRQAEEAHL